MDEVCLQWNVIFLPYVDTKRHNFVDVISTIHYYLVGSIMSSFLRQKETNNTGKIIL